MSSFAEAQSGVDGSSVKVMVALSIGSVAIATNGSTPWLRISKIPPPIEEGNREIQPFLLR